MTGQRSSIPLGVRLYPYVKPLLPKPWRLYLRKKHVDRIRDRCGNVWPIDRSAATPPLNWRGWPEGKKFAFVITHDVEGDKGVRNCSFMAEVEKQHGFRSSFNFVGEDYEVPTSLRRNLLEEGFEIGLHGLSHKKNMFRSKRVFLKQVDAINRYIREREIAGFRAPSMYHNLEWIHSLEIEYDMSTFDTDPFEPQPDGVGTIFPFWKQDGVSDRGYVELPYTLPQDYLVFVLMKEKTIDIWKRKLDWIASSGGMALFITHPDYIDPKNGERGLDEYPMELYEGFLKHVRDNFKGQYWHALPREVARFWKQNVRLYGPKDKTMNTRKEK